MVDELKLKIVATLATLTKYEAWTEQYIQNGMFQTNQATQKKKSWKIAMKSEEMEGSFLDQM